ncbi:hypothetical protein H1C71_014991, partial [Ictidomys tridecemlineatus]
GKESALPAEKRGFCSALTLSCSMALGGRLCSLAATGRKTLFQRAQLPEMALFERFSSVALQGALALRSMGPLLCAFKRRSHRRPGLGFEATYYFPHRGFRSHPGRRGGTPGFKALPSPGLA